MRHSGRNKTQTFTKRKPGKSKGSKDEWFLNKQQSNMIHICRTLSCSCLLVCLFVCLFVCSNACKILCLLARMLVCFCVCLFVYVFVCVLVCVCVCFNVMSNVLCGSLHFWLLMCTAAGTGTCDGLPGAGEGDSLQILTQCYKPLFHMQVQSDGWLTDLLRWVNACVCNACCIANTCI
jgi:hypothetical protein